MPSDLSFKFVVMFYESFFVSCLIEGDLVLEVLVACKYDQILTAFGYFDMGKVGRVYLENLSCEVVVFRKDQERLVRVDLFKTKVHPLHAKTRSLSTSNRNTLAAFEIQYIDLDGELRGLVDHAASTEVVVLVGTPLLKHCNLVKMSDFVF